MVYDVAQDWKNLEYVTNQGLVKFCVMGELDPGACAFSVDSVQSQTNKDDNFDISGTTNFFGNLTSDLNSECQKTSENMSLIIFPRVVKVANNFGQNPQIFGSSRDIL